MIESDGTVEIRESEARVAGTLKYVDDLVPPFGTLHGAYVRLPCARARIHSIDTAAASEAPGVRAVFTAADIPDPMPRYGVILMDQPILAVDETHFFGEPVAIVFADDPEGAQGAAQLVKVDYDALPPILDADQALKEDAELVLDPRLRPLDEKRDSNVMTAFRQSWGNVPEPDCSDNRCALVLDDIYQAPYIHHFAMEPYAAMAIPEDEGVTIVTAIQHPFQLRRIVAAMLGMPQSKVRVRAVEQGGGFGGRGYPKIEPAVAYFAKRLGRPVKIALTAEEGFMIAQRESARVRIRTGFAANGAIEFHDIVTDLCMGAYTDVAPRVVQKTGMLAAGPYRVPNVRVLCRGLYTHTAPTTAFRGFGAPHAGFAVESQLNEAAAILGVDPITIRLRNLPEKGDEIIPGETPADGDWKEAVRLLSQELKLDEPTAPGRGKGVALGIKNSVPATTSFARVRINADGSATAYVGTTEMGQGSRNTMAKIVSRALAIPLDSVSVVSGDTGVVPFDMLTASSRSTVTMGNALLDACRKAAARLREIGRDRFELDLNAELKNGELIDGTRRVPYRDLLAAEFGVGIGELEFEGAFRGEKDPAHPLGGKTPFYEFLATGVEVQVDQETGEVVIEKLVNVSDIGKAINPRRVIGLDEGGAVMGVGAAMMEHLVLDEKGRILNPSSLDYRIPTIGDTPRQMVSLTIENEDGPGPFGSKGMGEGGVLAIAPAVSEAVYKATGVRIRELPFSPERVWKALSTT